MSIESQALHGQVALITGASSGLGRSTALAFAKAGADVALLARSARDLEEVARDVESTHRRALALAVDLADEHQILDAIERMLDTLGRIDVLVNAAGTDVPSSLVDLSTEGWDRVLDVNLRAPFLLARAAFPSMAQEGRGTIINISSVAGKRGWANASAYCASKFGLTGLTQVLAAEGRARHSGLRGVSRWDGYQLGHVVSYGATDRTGRTTPTEPGAPTQRGCSAPSVDSRSATRIGPQRGNCYPSP